MATRPVSVPNHWVPVINPDVCSSTHPIARVGGSSDGSPGPRRHVRVVGPYWLSSPSLLFALLKTGFSFEVFRPSRSGSPEGELAPSTPLGAT